MDVSARNAALQCVFGDTRSANAPATWTVAIYDGHPDLGGLELTASGGYVAQPFANSTANWPTPTLGAITSLPIGFGTSTDAYSGVGTHIVLKDSGGAIWYVAALLADEEIDVTVAGQVVGPVRLTVDWNQVVI